MFSQSRNKFKSKQKVVRQKSPGPAFKADLVLYTLLAHALTGHKKCDEREESYLFRDTFHTQYIAVEPQAQTTEGAWKVGRSVACLTIHKYKTMLGVQHAMLVTRLYAILLNQSKM
jgi:hypothetical protein